MALWFRFYADAMRHPKVSRLTDAEFRLWVELLSVASDHNGHIPPLEELKHVLKRRLDYLSRGLEGLLRASLIDALEHGYEPHGWDKRQYKSDTSTPRVHKFREKRNVSVTAPETETEPETDITAAKATVIARKALSIPRGWEPILTERAQATVDGWPPGMFDNELVKFKDHASDKGRTSRDWQAGFRTWIANADKWSKQHGKNIRTGGNGGPDKRTGFERALDRRIGI